MFFSFYLAENNFSLCSFSFNTSCVPHLQPSHSTLYAIHFYCMSMIYKGLFSKSFKKYNREKTS